MSESPTQDALSASLSSPNTVHFGAEPFETGHANVEFLKPRIPYWYIFAPEPLRQALRASHERSLISRKVLEPIRTRLKSVEAFSKPLLEEALYKRFKLRLDSKGYQLYSLIFDKSYFFTTPGTVKQTLLQAALHNFDESQCSGQLIPDTTLSLFSD